VGVALEVSAMAMIFAAMVFSGAERLLHIHM
jgi:hypothetical protein